jgi:hypothetical protein
MYNLISWKRKNGLRIEEIISELEDERENLILAIEALKAGGATRRRRRRRLTAAARGRISEGMKRRWAERKKKKAS